MATNKLKISSRDVEDFATDLYDYIWTQHRFRSESLEKVFAEKLSFMIENSKEKATHFDHNIGEAVLCSQYLLREYCEYVFNQYKSDLIENTVFYSLCVCNAIMSWIVERDNIFLKVIDSAAIIAEAVLFCDAKLNMVIELSRATTTFIHFFETFLKKEFFASGGWSELSATSIRDYHNLYFSLKPYLFLMTLPYETLYHSCYLTKRLREAPVAFPIVTSLLCNKCQSPSDVYLRGYVTKKDSFYTYFKNMLKDGSILEGDSSQKTESLVKQYLETFSDNKFEYKIEDFEGQDCFVYVMFGKKEQIETTEGVKIKKHKKKKRKSKSTEKSRETDFTSINRSGDDGL